MNSLKGEINLLISMKADVNGFIVCWVDVSFTVHNYVIIHMGKIMEFVKRRSLRILNKTKIKCKIFNQWRTIRGV